MPHKLQAGMAKSVISPPIGISLAGYATRPGGAAGIHDDLFCKAVVFANGETRAAVVSLDILGLDFEQVKWIREKVRERSGIPERNIYAASSHTHAGPATQFLRFCGTMDEGYIAGMLETVVKTVCKANEDISPCTIKTGETISDLAINRRQRAQNGEILLADNTGGFCDKEVKFVHIVREGRTGAVLYNYACHGVVLGHDNVEVSADWIGAASSFIEENTGEMALFLQGCCGNINPRIRGGFDQVKAAGNLVGSAVTAALPGAAASSGNSTISSASTKVELPLQPLPSREELLAVNREQRDLIESQRKKGVPECSLDWNKALEEWSRTALDRVESGIMESSLPIELGVLRIDGFRIFAIPGEAFAELGQSVKSMASDVIVAGYMNGNIGYIPTAAAYDEGGYEVETAYKLYGVQMIGRETEGIILEAAKKLLR